MTTWAENQPVAGLIGYVQAGYVQAGYVGLDWGIASAGSATWSETSKATKTWTPA